MDAASLPLSLPRRGRRSAQAVAGSPGRAGSGARSPAERTPAAPRWGSRRGGECGRGAAAVRVPIPPRVSPLRSAPPRRLYRTANKRPAGNWYGGRARGSADPRPGMGLPGAAPPPGYCLRAGEQQGEQQPRGGMGAQPCSHPPGGGLDRAAMGSEHLHSRSNSRACCSGAARQPQPCRVPHSLGILGGPALPHGTVSWRARRGVIGCDEKCLDEDNAEPCS